MLDELAITNCTGASTVPNTGKSITPSMPSGQNLYCQECNRDGTDSAAQENLYVCDAHSEGFFQEFYVRICFLRPEGATEVKDPNWLKDSGFGYIAPGSFGCHNVWQRMTESARARCCQQSINQFIAMNGIPWCAWYSDYLERCERRQTL